MENKRKPRLNTNMGCMMPYRYVMIKVLSIKKVSNEDKFGFCQYEIGYCFDESDYYYDKYGDETFRLLIETRGKPYYKIGQTIRTPMVID